MKQRWHMLVLLAAVALAYANTLQNSFTYDDFPYVLNNPAVTNPSLTGFFVPTKVSNVFRPVMFASFALNWKLGEIHPLGYHLFNLLLHAAVTLLLYLVLRRLLETMPHSVTLAFVAALLFAVHPIHTEAVASIVGRSELLAAAFLLAAWLFHLRDQPLPALLCFALALFSKESAIAFLPLVLAADYLTAKLKPWGRYVVIAAIAALYIMVLWTAEGGRFGEASVHFVDNPLAKLPTPWRILNALRIAWKYLALQIYPATLSSDYSYNALPTYIHWRYVLHAAVASLAVVALWIWAMSKRRSGWALAGAIYFAGFLVTANVLLPTGTIMGERLAYLPSAGFCLLLALVWVRLVDYRQALSWALLATAVVALGTRTIVRNRDWKTNLTLFSATVRDAPGSARAHSNMGGQYMDQGRLDLAAAEFQTALRIFPDFPDALEFYGIVQSRQGHDQEARQLLEHAFSLTQKDNLTYDYRAVNLAAHLIKMGHQDQEALRILDDAAAEAPNNPRIWSNRAVVHLRQGEIPQAKADAETALRLDPLNNQAKNVLNATSGAATSAVAPVP